MYDIDKSDKYEQPLRNGSHFSANTVDDNNCNYNDPKFTAANGDNCFENIETKFSDSNTIPVTIGNKTMECLIDTGASINLIDHDSFHSLDVSHKLAVKPPRVKFARTANNTDLEITGFVVMPVSVKGSEFQVPMNIARNLSQQVILGSHFLRKHKANIDFGSQSIRLCKKSQLRVVNRQEIPPRSQSVVRARISNKLPRDIVGLCQGGRRVTALGVLVANTISPIDKTSCATNKSCCTTKLLVMNVTDEPIILYPRTKLGTYTLVNDSDIFPFIDIDNSVVDEQVSSIDANNVNNTPDTKVRDEILSQVHMNTEKMTTSESEMLRNLISEYADVFQTKNGPRGRYTKIEHSIRTGDHVPIKCRPYRQPPHVQAEIRKQVNQMLDDGLIRESTSSWCFPVIMTPKPDNTLRFCVDFRLCNQIVERDNFPLPNIDDALDSLGTGKPKYFSTLDLASGYWQIGVEEESKNKTAFITQDGLYEFNVMPMGLSNAPATFQRAMQEVLRGLHWKFVLIYLDDVIVFSNSFHEHLDHLRQVFQRLREAGLKLKPSKCTFGQQQVRYLGHIVNEDGIETDPDKIKVVRDYPVPTNVKEVRRYLGFIGYYRKYVKDYCKIAEPLTKLTRKDVSFIWSQECSEAFEILKQKLLQPPILAYPRFDGTKFILQTDASTKGLGFILAQKQDGEEKVICYGGRALHNSERNYTTTELEALAVVEGIKKYSPYLQHSVKFLIVTDHCALKWLFGQKRTTGRLARWILKLQSYNYDVIHVRGRNNSNADAISRMQFPECCDSCISCHAVSPISLDEGSNWVECGLENLKDDAISDPPESEPTQPKVDLVRNLRYQRNRRVEGNNNDKYISKVPTFPQEIDLDNFKQALVSDSYAGKMLKYLEQDILPDDQRQARDILLQADQYIVHEGLLYHIWHTPAKRHMPERNSVQLYIPVTCIDMVLNNCHDHTLAAHFGFQRTYSKIRQRYFWKKMYKDIDNWVRSCISCAQRKTHRHKVLAPMMTMTIPGVFERVSVDILGPLPITVSGNRYVLCFTDHCTRWPILVPIKTTDASTVAKVFFTHVICEHGCPQTLLSDRGANFLSKLVLEVCRIMRTTKLNTSSYHPQCNAIQERFNSVILDTVSHYVNSFHTNWDEYIPAIQFAYRSTPADNSVGFSPFFLLFGREARLPLDVTLLAECNYPNRTVRDHMHNLISQLEVHRAISRRHAESNQAAMKKRYDERTQDVSLQVGDTVWLYIPVTQPGLSRKLMKFWSGPYLLVEQTGPVNFRVRNLVNNKLLSAPVHVNRMKFAYDRYVRPENHVMPKDFVQRDPLEGIVDDDCPDDSFDPLMASQESHLNNAPIVPGLPVICDQDPREYEIEKVIRGRYRNNKLQYLIKWRDFPNSRNTWEPVENLNQATLDFLQKNPVKISGKIN